MENDEWILRVSPKNGPLVSAVLLGPKRALPGERSRYHLRARIVSVTLDELARIAFFLGASVEFPPALAEEFSAAAERVKGEFEFEREEE